MTRLSRGVRFPLWAAALILAGAALVTSITLVGAHGGDASKIHSCINKYNGWIRIIPANGFCTSIENPLDWSQSGATGPTGPTGPSGPSGPAGAAGQLNGVREYTASGTFTVPAGVTKILVEAIGGGGGGGGSDSVAESGGGGAGGYVRAVVTVPAGVTCDVWVGLGGTGGYFLQAGVAGGASYLDCGSGALITAAGGAAGTAYDIGGLGGGGTLPANPAGQGVLRPGGAGESFPTHAGGAAIRGSMDVLAGDGGAGGIGSLKLGQPGQPGWVLIQW